MNSSQPEFNVAVLTVSDRAFAGSREDASGPALQKQLLELGYHVQRSDIVPDGGEELRQKLLDYAKDKEVDLVVTTGGTGLSPRDLTPEVTLAVAHRQVPGMMEICRRRCSEITPLAALSRGVAVTIDETLLLNLPGNPKAAVESLAALQDILPHALAILSRTPADCRLTGSQNKKLDS